MKKSEKLQREINNLINRNCVKDYEFDVMKKNSVVIWTYEKEDNEGGIITCNYIEWHPKHKGWFTNEIAELEGPADLTCPIRFFTYEADPEFMFPEWRYEVKKYHEGIGENGNEVMSRLINSCENKYKNNP